MPDLDLHADSEDWPGNRDEEECEACHGPRVVFIPVWENGSGILTVEEIAECIGKATADIIFNAEQDAQTLGPMSREMPDNVVMHIEGYRDGTYLVTISNEEGGYKQAYTRYGKGSSYRGVRTWRHGLAMSPATEQITTQQDLDNGVLVYRGSPGTLRFRVNGEYRPSPEVREALRAQEAVRDRIRPTTSWERHKAALRKRAESVLPPEGYLEAGEG